MDNENKQSDSLKRYLSETHPLLKIGYYLFVIAIIWLFAFQVEQFEISVKTSTYGFVDVSVRERGYNIERRKPDRERRLESEQVQQYSYSPGLSGFVAMIITPLLLPPIYFEYKKWKGRKTAIMEDPQ